MKVMALDYGDARTGVAVSDATGMIVGFTTVISEWNRERAAQKVAQLVNEHRPETLVMGFPRNMDGTEGPRAALYREFAALVEQATGMDVVLWDERRTTIEAHQILSANGKKTSLNVSSNYALIAEKYNMDITASDTFSKDIELLLAGRTDCVINNTIAFNDFLTQKPDTPIKIAAVQEQADTVAVPIPKGNDDLVEAVNKAIAELQADGTLTELSNKYLGKDFSKELTLEEIQQ